MRHAVILAVVAVAGCSNLLGIHDPTPAPTDSGGPGSGFAFEIAPVPARVGLGRSAMLPITVMRASDFDDAIDFALRDPPTGVSLDALEVPAGATTGSATLTIAASATKGAPSLEVIGIGGGVTAMQTIQIAIVDPPGALDPAFGVGGTVISPFAGLDSGVAGGALLGSGEVLFGGFTLPGAGSSQLAFGEVTATGSGVSGVGSDGTIVTATPVSLSATTGVAVTSGPESGGEENPLFAITAPDGTIDVLSFRPDGSPDMSFGLAMSGSATIDVGAPAQPMVVVEAGTDPIYVAGIAQSGSGSFGFVGGLLAGGFGTPFSGGFVSLGSDTEVFGATAGSDHGVIVVGSTLVHPLDRDALVVEFDGTGHPESGFGIGGAISFDFGGDEHGTSVVRNADGSLYIGFVTSQVNTPRAAIVRLAANGMIDRTFGSDGVVVFDALHPVQTVAVVVGASGEIYLDIEVFDGGEGSTSIAALDSTGTADPAFGDDGTGVATISIGSDIVLGAPLGFDAAGELVIIGNTTSAAHTEPFVAKVFP